MNPLPLRVFGVGLRDELRGVVREPTALFCGVVMPVGILVLFNLLHGSQASQGLSAGTAVVATFGAHGVITVASLLGALHAWPLAFAVCAATTALWGKPSHANGSPRRIWSAIVPMAVLGAGRRGAARRAARR
ncbi:hypothetical protein [Actinosynnema pretiosum]|uniref:Uncharacterized protein n=1 Tax=Actinosynnema pretiosum TaxID=42197 RepID=A0A290ZA42_9PSEU|nr:hypothetical protein [Actinosynnema pretiosum]ATE55839.1 hypothetical protein CNX65_23285 [Actinosynnema pretiosum]